MEKLLPVESPAKEKTAFDHPVIQWSAPEFQHYERGPLWFTIGGALVLVLVLYGIWSGSWTESIVFLLLASVYYLTHHEKPRQIDVILSEMGVKVGDKTYPFSAIKTFWILYHPPHVKKIGFRPVENWAHDVTISIEDQNPVELRNFLVTQIPEWEGKQETFTELLTRFFKL